ncbi:MAG: ABC transporter ATP-binding protein [Coriobacteriales bacterium]
MQKGAFSIGANVIIDHVSKDYGRGELAVDDMSLEIHAGEFFSVLGSSGSGKSTTLKMLSGLEFPTAGHIYLGQEEVTKVPANRRDVHTVFQNYALFPHMSVWDNVAYGLKIHHLGAGDTARLVDEMLEMVEMTSFAKAKPGDLSGGQQQRVALARALVMGPKALLLDEPLGALDLKLRHHMQDVLRDIHSQVGTTFVYVTHDQEEAFSMSHRVAVMDKGKLKQVATPEELYAHPANRFVADFVGSANMIAGVVSAERGTDSSQSLYQAEFPGLGSLVCPGVKGLQPGDAVCAVLRPQDIWLADLTGDGVVSVEGPVSNRMFSGAFARVTAQAAGMELQCLLTGNGNTGAGLQSARMSWRSADMWLVKDN